MAIADIATKYFNKNKELISEYELLSMYESKLEDIASRYESGGLDWLHANFPELYAAIEGAENKLNKTWSRTLAGHVPIKYFKAALCKWHEAQVKSIEVYIKRRKEKNSDFGGNGKNP